MSATANTTSSTSIIGGAGRAPGVHFAVWDVTPAAVTEVRRPSTCELCQACWWPRLRRSAQASTATATGQLSVDTLNGANGVVPA